MTMMKFEVYKGNNKEHYFKLVDDTGKTLLSSEGYKQKASVINGLESVKKNLPVTGNIEKKMSSDGRFFFNVKSGNGQVVGTSGMFDSPELRDQWLIEMQREVNNLQVTDTGN